MKKNYTVAVWHYSCGYSKWESLKEWATSLLATENTESTEKIKGKLCAQSVRALCGKVIQQAHTNIQSPQNMLHLGNRRVTLCSTKITREIIPRSMSRTRRQ